VLVGWIVMGCLVLGLLVAQRAERPRWEWLLKPAAALTFVVTGVARGGLETPFGRVLVAGLVLAACGDVLLIPKGKATFLGGLLAFLAGHVAYAVAFVVHGVNGKVAALSLLALSLVGALVLRWLWPHVERPMRVPVLAYVVVISAMVALAAGTGAGLLLLGAFAFYLSDLAVARDRFVVSSFVNRLWGLPLYFFAQMLIASQAGG
jgi:uncharacterized membrane protein YhhN